MGTCLRYFPLLYISCDSHNLHKRSMFDSHEKPTRLWHNAFTHCVDLISSQSQKKKSNSLIKNDRIAVVWLATIELRCSGNICLQLLMDKDEVCHVSCGPQECVGPCFLNLMASGCKSVMFSSVYITRIYSAWGKVSAGGCVLTFPHALYIFVCHGYNQPREVTGYDTGYKA